MGERLRAFGMLNLVLALDGVRSSRGVDESRMVVTDQFVAEFSVHGRGRRVTAQVLYGSTAS